MICPITKQGIDGQDNVLLSSFVRCRPERRSHTIRRKVIRRCPALRRRGSSLCFFGRRWKGPGRVPDRFDGEVAGELTFRRREIKLRKGGSDMGGQNTVEWDVKNGMITLHNGTSYQRILLKRYDFVFSFIDEMTRVLGTQVFLMVFRKIFEKYGAPEKLIHNPSIDAAGIFVDSLIVPVDIEKSVIPDDVAWDGKTRNIEFFGSTQWRILPVSFVHNFRSSIYEVLTENGTRAIVREATKRAGIGMAEQALENYRWKTAEDLVENQDEKIYLGTFAYAGWSYSRVFSRKGADGNYLFLAKISNTYESEGVTGETRPFCQWLMSYMDGFYNGVIGKLSGKFVETREVRCRAMGDPYCAFAHKIKDNKKDILDWEELESSWKELDAIELPSAA
jgi:hypothetical protein